MIFLCYARRFFFLFFALDHLYFIANHEKGPFFIAGTARRSVSWWILIKKLPCLFVCIRGHEREAWTRRVNPIVLFDSGKSLSKKKTSMWVCPRTESPRFKRLFLSAAAFLRSLPYLWSWANKKGTVLWPELWAYIHPFSQMARSIFAPRTMQNEKRKKGVFVLYVHSRIWAVVITFRAVLSAYALRRSMFPSAFLPFFPHVSLSVHNPDRKPRSSIMYVWMWILDECTLFSFPLCARDMYQRVNPWWLRKCSYYAHHATGLAKLIHLIPTSLPYLLRAQQDVQTFCRIHIVLIN